LLCLCFFLWAAVFAFAQDGGIIDSIEQILKTAKEDKTKVDLLNDLAWEYKMKDAEKARALLNNAITLADKLAYAKGKGQAYNNLGVVETIHGSKAKAIDYYTEALHIRESLKDQKGLASLYNNIGNLYAEQDSFPLAIENLKQSLELRKVLQDTPRIARVYYNLADTYEDWGDYSAALDNAFAYREWSAYTGDPYELLNAANLMGNILSELERWEEAGIYKKQAMEMAFGLNDNWEIAIASNNMANYKDDLGEKAYDKKAYDKARTYYLEAMDLHQKALALRLNEGDESSISASYNNLGVVYKNYGSLYEAVQKQDSATYFYELALNYLNRALEIRLKEQDAKGICEVYNGIGDVKRRQGKFKEALLYAQQYLAIAKDIKDGKFEQNAYKDLSKVYTELGDYKSALEYQKLYDELRYKRLNEERVRINIKREALYGDFNKQLEIERKEAELKQAAIKQRALIGGGIALLVLALLLYNQNRIKSHNNKMLKEKNDIIENERQKSERLLLNILPAATAAELKVYGKTKARHYESVTVLFTDFKYFTQATEQLTADELVSLLDEYYCAFDEIISQYGIEKIKTIGDAYMCAAGLPEPSDTHATDMVRAALAMQNKMEVINQHRKAAGQAVLEMRIGMHTGAVIAGVVGSKKFAYDIWGDTVNVAARMEAAGEVGKVNISAVTYGWVKTEFACQYRGQLAAKNKGEMDMYFVEEKRGEGTGKIISVKAANQ
jgi:adenylate cyclase